MKTFFSSLYFRIAIVFLLALLIVTGIYINLSIVSARKYYDEVNQKLNFSLASHTVHEISPFVNDSINEEAIQHIMHSMMTINPAVEVYLLDTAGNILTYVAPYKQVKMNSISLAPIKKFLADTIYQHTLLGDDPRNPGEEKVFSAAVIKENNKIKGYLYIILASQEYVSAATTMMSSYILKLGVRTMLIILISTALIGLLALYLITRNLRIITEGVRRFQYGNFSSRISIKSTGELCTLTTAFNDMATTIQDNIEEIKGLEKLRRELIANISHDLRTPISSIHGYAETLMLKKAEISNQDADKYIEIIINNSSHLKKLVDDLFELSKMEANERKPKPEPLSIGELVQDVVSQYRLMAQQKGISINTILSKDQPLIFADIALIDRALQNIIDNAVKFCSAGDLITIEVNQMKHTVEVKISDTGAGIAAEDLPHIFDRFYYKTFPGQKEKSSGLGLAIVKKIFDLHQTSISVQSNPEKGTTFSFQLPVYKV